MDVNYHVTVCLPFKGVPYGSQECVLIETTSTCLVGSQTTCLPTNLTFVMEYGAHYLKWIDVGDALVIFSSWFLCFSLYFFFLSSSCPALHSGDSFLSCWCCCCFFRFKTRRPLSTNCHFVFYSGSLFLKRCSLVLSFLKRQMPIE